MATPGLTPDPGQPIARSGYSAYHLFTRRAPALRGLARHPDEVIA